MKKLSDLSISQISALITPSSAAYLSPAGTPDRPIGAYRNWSSTLHFLRSINPLIPNSQREASKLINILTEKSVDLGYVKTSLVNAYLGYWNEKSPEMVEKSILFLLDSRYYYTSDRIEIMKVYAKLNEILSLEQLTIGSYPPKILPLTNISPEERIGEQWQMIWYLASKNFQTSEEIIRKVGSIMLSGNYDETTRSATEVVFDRLRRISDELRPLDGEELITKALRKNAILRCNITDPVNEEWARKKLAAKLSALYQAYRNPQSHHFKINDPWETALAVWNADWCYKEIEKLEVDPKKVKVENVKF